ncbi:hypothetical protein COT78_00665 [Candidatus Berkelbacteria bacterium CG10_big_fil_rev_8_21_14_0_10_43_13]|uniref:t-SNARE coiled-coil homology domain-containing protein n=1 Tax=Candidatus Berkelbacteria bacterium CG10_big_fil_rev_8_21_14_0_10_43_13 TaxID=1974514 RepID=A0A2H0W7C0_9BACT|nr:MAG: hypothetical protein COT78_00665 [Candidatus Berkelbacteria bacterium CG10_big_fil_rev_8_21_14_0_10_43_13]
MPLNEKDLTQIKDIVTFAVDQSEMRVSGRLDKIVGRLDKVENRLEKVEENIDGLIETNQAFLDKFQDHEV